MFHQVPKKPRRPTEPVFARPDDAFPRKPALLHSMSRRNGSGESPRGDVRKCPERFPFRHSAASHTATIAPSGSSQVIITALNSRAPRHSLLLPPGASTIPPLLPRIASVP